MFAVESELDGAVTDMVGLAQSGEEAKDSTNVGKFAAIRICFRGMAGDFIDSECGLGVGAAATQEKC